MKCVIRVVKVKTPGGVKAVLDHNTRAVPTPSADPALEAKNRYLKGTNEAGQIVTYKKENLSVGLYRRFQEIIAPLRSRKDSVHMLDYVVGIPKEAGEMGWDEQTKRALLADSYRWIERRHGKAAIVGAHIHEDERGDIHLHVDVVPIGTVRDKHGHEYQSLTARPWMGSRQVLRNLQTDYHREVGKVYGLERGTPGSQAFHQEPADFWREVAREKEIKRQLNAVAREPIRRVLVENVKKTNQMGYGLEN